MTETLGTPAPRGSRWLKVGLVASLALNVLLIGGIGAAAYKFHRSGGPIGRPGFDMGLKAFARSLPEERRRALRADFKGERERMRPLREDIRVKWVAANEVLGVDPFDSAKFQAAVDEAVKAEMALRAAVSTTLVEATSKLTPEERKQFKDWRSRYLERFLKRKEKKDDPVE